MNFQSHKQDQESENIVFLLDTCGMHIEQVARRLGLSVNTVEKKLERARDRSGDPAEVEATRDETGARAVPQVRRSRPSWRVAPPTRESGS